MDTRKHDETTMSLAAQLRYQEAVWPNCEFDFILKCRREKAKEDRRGMGWGDVFNEMRGQPYCKIQKRLTTVFECPETHKCKRTGQCVMCFNEGKCHALVSRENLPKCYVTETRNASLCEEWSPEKGKRLQNFIYRLKTEFSHEDKELFLPIYAEQNG